MENPANLAAQLSIMTLGGLRPRASPMGWDIDCQPDCDTLDTLADYSLLRTDQHGWIQTATDGKQMGVKVEK